MNKPPSECIKCNYLTFHNYHETLCPDCYMELRRQKDEVFLATLKKFEEKFREETKLLYEKHKDKPCVQPYPKSKNNKDLDKCPNCHRNIRRCLKLKEIHI